MTDAEMTELIQKLLAYRLDVWNERADEPWRAGKTVGVKSKASMPTFGQWLQWGGEVGHLMHNVVVPTLKGLAENQNTLMAVVAAQEQLLQQLLNRAGVDLNAEQFEELRQATVDAVAASTQKLREQLDKAGEALGEIEPN